MRHCVSRCAYGWACHFVTRSGPRLPGAPCKIKVGKSGRSAIGASLVVRSISISSSTASVRTTQHAGYHGAVETTSKYDAHLQRKLAAAAGEAATYGCIDAVVQMEDAATLFGDTTVRHPVHTKSHLERGAMAEAGEAYVQAGTGHQLLRDLGRTSENSLPSRHLASLARMRLSLLICFRATSMVVLRSCIARLYTTIVSALRLRSVVITSTSSACGTTGTTTLWGTHPLLMVENLPRGVALK